MGRSCASRADGLAVELLQNFPPCRGAQDGAPGLIFLLVARSTTRSATVVLQNFHADPGVFAYRAEDFVLYAEGFDEGFEGAKFVEGADEVVEENNVARLEMAAQGGEHEERGAVEVGVQMDDEAPGKIVGAYDRQQRVLEKTDLESAARVIRFGQPAIHVEGAFGFGGAPTFGQAGKSVESHEARFGIGNIFEPRK